MEPVLRGLKARVPKTKQNAARDEHAIRVNRHRPDLKENRHASGSSLVSGMPPITKKFEDHKTRADDDRGISHD